MRFCIGVFGTLLIILTGCLTTGPTTVASSYFVGKTVQAILDDFDRHATKLIKEGELSANVVVARAGNELHVATQNAALALGAERQKTFESLSRERRNVLEELGRFRDSLQSSTSVLVGIEDAAAMDLERLIPLRDHPEFYLRRIENYTVSKGRPVYSVAVRGAGLGFAPSDRVRQSLTVTVGQSRLSDASIQKMSVYDVKLIVPATILDPLFKDGEIVAVPVRLEGDIETSSGLGRTRTTHHEVTFNLLLLPTFAGNLTLSIVKKVQEFPSERFQITLEPIYVTMLDPGGGPPRRIEVTRIPRILLFGSSNIQSKEVVQPVPGSSTNSPFQVHLTERVADNQKITSVSFRCEGGNPCRWCYDIGGRNSSIATDGRSVELFQKCDGDAVTLFWTIYYVTAEVSLQTLPEYATVRPTYSGCFSFDLPKDTVDWKLSGRLFDGHTVEIIRGRPSNDFDTCAEEAIGDAVRVSLRLKPPV